MIPPPTPLYSPLSWSVGETCSWFLFFCFFKYLFIYLWLCWVFVSVRGLSLVAASGGHSSSRCAGPSPSRPLLLRSTGCRRTGSVIAAHGPSRSAARGILPDQGLNPCPLHWQADSQPLRHQGSPCSWFLTSIIWKGDGKCKVIMLILRCFHEVCGRVGETCVASLWVQLPGAKGSLWSTVSKNPRS